MKLKSIVLTAIIAASTCSLLAEIPVTTELIKQRGVFGAENTSRLTGVMEKARHGESITIAAIGGSITAGGSHTKNPENRYIARLAAWFTKTFPRAKIRDVNAGIGGTNSIYGAMRLKADVLSKKPDLVVVEFAVNNKEGMQYSESYESVLRQLLREPQNIAVIELFFMHRKGENEQMWQQILGRHYGLPMVSFRDAWWPEMCAGRAVWEEVYDDVVHPNDNGHLLASELLISLLETAKRTATTGAVFPPISRELPTPMISDVYEDCEFITNEALAPTANAGWTRSADGKKWESPVSDGAVTFEFTGKALYLGYDMDKGAEPFTQYAIDDGALQPLTNDGNRPQIASNLPLAKHRIRIVFSGSKAAQPATDKVRIWGVGAAGVKN